MRYTSAFAALVAVGAAVPTSELDRRQDSSACPVATSSDTPQSFFNNPTYASNANGAATPANFTKAFTDLFGATQQAGYLNYQSVGSYDPSICAATCQSLDGCVAFNIYYERMPAVAPGPNCTNPASTPYIKCAYYSQTIVAATATNYGQYMYDFIVDIAGSNGYNLVTGGGGTGINSNPTGYSGGTSLPAVINAPTQCNSYITVKEFGMGDTFDADTCATACSEETAYNQEYLNSRAVCRFFVTYIKSLNGVPISQECALYTASWDASYATNTGYSSGSDVYTYSDIYSYSNATDPETDSCSCGIGSVCNTGTAASAPGNSTTAATRRMARALPHY